MPLYEQFHVEKHIARTSHFAQYHMLMQDAVSGISRGKSYAGKYGDPTAAERGLSKPYLSKRTLIRNDILVGCENHLFLDASATQSARFWRMSSPINLWVCVGVLMYLVCGASSVKLPILPGQLNGTLAYQTEQCTDALFWLSGDFDKSDCVEAMNKIDAEVYSRWDIEYEFLSRNVRPTSSLPTMMVPIRYTAGERLLFSEILLPTISQYTDVI